jgi:hypothetical protein
MARRTKTVVFLPTALRRGTRQNAFWFEMCKENYFSISFGSAKKGKSKSAAFIPGPKGCLLPTIYHLIEERDENAGGVGPPTMGRNHVWIDSPQGYASDKACCEHSGSDGT